MARARGAGCSGVFEYVLAYCVQYVRGDACARISSRYCFLENLGLMQPMAPGVSANTAMKLGEAPGGDCGKLIEEVDLKSDATTASITRAFLRGLAILSTSMYCLLSLSLH